ncbi:adenosylmethionine decarboxylase [Marinobacterium sp. AK62]|uniref:S-adenosylmethionine decarboxylase proenzyme n=1 Tax=Marinobacterium alkalitolerans TaxID=1542925 RepID=A0ABS3ZCH5_9GAMM|nr:adenosylmethionine decarboxylase [Marinobacterium alkalitolerans]MBP0049020.1 adenosylmethionine decarboxylase [Marinobacterium alkalitolerans]
MQEARDLSSEVIDQEAAGSVADWPAYTQGEDEERLDFFIERDGHRYAGTHLIIDLRGASRLDDLEVMEKALRDSIKAAKATLLHIHLHHFTPNGGISGVAVLAESHISVHTWPERNFAAFDVFMCGESEPVKAIPVLEEAFAPTQVDVEEILRGKVSIDEDDYLS